MNIWQVPNGKTSKEERKEFREKGIIIDELQKGEK